MPKRTSIVPAKPLLALLLATALGTGLGTGLAHAQTATTTTPTTGATPGITPMPAVQAKASSVARADRKFVEKAMHGGMAEVELGKLAQQRAADPKVKAFGERMVQDHGKAGDELTKIASAKGIVVGAHDKSHQRMVDKLGKRSGADFDRDYMKHMVDDHKKDVDDFEKAAKSSKDSEIKDFAARTLPTLQEHLALARSTYDAVRKSR